MSGAIERRPPCSGSLISVSTAEISGMKSSGSDARSTATKQPDGRGPDRRKPPTILQDSAVYPFFVLARDSGELVGVIIFGPDIPTTLP